MSIAGQLTELLNQKNALADNLAAMGVEAARSETLNTLVPKVLTIGAGHAPLLQEKTATTNGIVLPDAPYDGLSRVTVNVGGGGGGACSFLRVGIADPTQGPTLTVTKDGVALAPADTAGGVYKYMVTEPGVWTVATDTLSQEVDVAELFRAYEVWGDVPPLVNGVYYISYDKGDYMQYSSRRLTRVYPSGTPLLMGLSKHPDNWTCPVIAAGRDLGGIDAVISATYKSKAVGTFQDGTAGIYEYGCFSGGFMNCNVDIYHGGVRVTTINGTSPRLSLPWPYAGRPKIVCSDESLVRLTEAAIRFCGSAQGGGSP